MLGGCGTLTGIPSHGGGKRFATEQRLVSASIRSALKDIDLTPLRGKRAAIVFDLVHDEGGGSMEGGRLSLLGSVARGMVSSPVTNTASAFQVFNLVDSGSNYANSSFTGASSAGTSFVSSGSANSQGANTFSNSASGNANTTSANNFANTSATTGSANTSNSFANSNSGSANSTSSGTNATTASGTSGQTGANTLAGASTGNVAATGTSPYVSNSANSFTQDGTSTGAANFSNTSAATLSGAQTSTNTGSANGTGNASQTSASTASASGTGAGTQATSTANTGSGSGNASQASTSTGNANTNQSGQSNSNNAATGGSDTARQVVAGAPVNTSVQTKGFDTKASATLNYKGLGEYQNFNVPKSDASLLMGLVRSYLLLSGITPTTPTDKTADVLLYVTVDVFGIVRSRTDLYLYNQEHVKAETSFEITAYDRDGKLILAPTSANREAHYAEHYLLWAGPFKTSERLEKGQGLLVDFSDVAEIAAQRTLAAAAAAKAKAKMPN